MHADKKKFLEWSMPGYSENCVSGGGEIIVYKSPTYSKCLLLAQCPKHKQNDFILVVWKKCTFVKNEKYTHSKNALLTVSHFKSNV